MSTLEASIEGIGFWAHGLPSWDAARGHVRGDAIAVDAPARPAPPLLPPNERRRAPASVAVALEVAQAACAAAARDPASLPSVFASTHGELAITDYMCTTLASEPATISPTRFHNSVHNAAAGYWTIGTGCMQAATALSAYRASFAQGLIEALAQLAENGEAVLLVGYDAPSAGPLAGPSPSHGVLGAALVLSREARATAPRLRVTLTDGRAPEATGPLTRQMGGNAMAPMLPLFEALARGGDLALLDAGPGRLLRVEIAHG